MHYNSKRFMRTAAGLLAALTLLSGCAPSDSTDLSGAVSAPDSHSSAATSAAASSAAVTAAVDVPAPADMVLAAESGTPEHALLSYIAPDYAAAFTSGLCSLAMGPLYVEEGVQDGKTVFTAAGTLAAYGGYPDTDLLAFPVMGSANIIFRASYTQAGSRVTVLSYEEAMGAIDEDEVWTEVRALMGRLGEKPDVLLHGSEAGQRAMNAAYTRIREQSGGVYTRPVTLESHSNIPFYLPEDDDFTAIHGIERTELLGTAVRFLDFCAEGKWTQAAAMCASGLAEELNGEAEDDAQDGYGGVYARGLEGQLQGYGQLTSPYRCEDGYGAIVGFLMDGSMVFAYITLEDAADGGGYRIVDLAVNP